MHSFQLYRGSIAFLFFPGFGALAGTLHAFCEAVAVHDGSSYPLRPADFSPYMRYNRYDEMDSKNEKRRSEEDVRA